jgi:rhodanese-related sulfurtransferase
MADDPRITVADLKNRMDRGEEFTFIDIRNPQAWGESNVMLPGALRITFDNLDQELSRIPRDKPIVAYCT